MNKSDELKLRLPPWRKEKIRRAAELAGESMSEYMLIAVDRRINQERDRMTLKTSHAVHPSGTLSQALNY